MSENRTLVNLFENSAAKYPEEENGFINSTLKMVRWKICEFYKDRIDYMYTPEGKDVFNHRNMTIVRRLWE